MAFPLEGGFAVAAELRAEALALGRGCISDLEVVVERGTPVLRQTALEVLAELDPDGSADRALRTLRHDADNEVRGAAAALMAKDTTKASFAALLGALADPARFVWEAALDALAGRRDEGIAQALIAAFEELAPGDPHAERFFATIALRDEAEAKAFVSRAIDGDTPMTSLVVGAASVDALVQIVTRRADRERRDAANALRPPRELGPAHRDAILGALERTFWTNGPPCDSLLELAATLAFRREPAEAFTRFAPYLSRAEVRDDLGVARARALLRTIEDAIGTASVEDREEDDEDAPAIDPRWRAPVEALVDVREIGDVALAAAKALRWLTGDFELPRVVSVNLGEGDDEPFPFFVAGFELPYGFVLDEARLASIPGTARVHSFAHQCGGYACHQASFLGIAVRAPAGLFAADPAAALADAWLDSHGEPMTDPDLEEWTRAIRAHVAVPAFASGQEAILVTVACFPAASLRGLSTLHFRARARPWEGVHFYGPPPAIEDAGPYDDAHDASLAELGDALGLGRPRIILLWGNSD